MQTLLWISGPAPGYSDEHSKMKDFFGGSPGSVLIRLAVISIIVGVVLSTIGLDPYDIIHSIRLLVRRIYEMGFDAVEWVFRYFVLGAVIVFPIWLIGRLVAATGRGRSGKSDTDEQPPVAGR